MRSFSAGFEGELVLTAGTRHKELKARRRPLPLSCRAQGVALRCCPGGCYAGSCYAGGSVTQRGCADPDETSCMAAICTEVTHPSSCVAQVYHPPNDAAAGASKQYTVVADEATLRALLPLLPVKDDILKARWARWPHVWAQLGAAAASIARAQPSFCGCCGDPVVLCLQKRQQQAEGRLGRRAGGRPPSPPAAQAASRPGQRAAGPEPAYQLTVKRASSRPLLQGAAYASCAVVGSSGSLLLHSKGAEIDSHEAVRPLAGAAYCREGKGRARGPTCSTSLCSRPGAAIRSAGYTPPVLHRPLGPLGQPHQGWCDLTLNRSVFLMNLKPHPMLPPAAGLPLQRRAHGGL